MDAYPYPYPYIPVSILIPMMVRSVVTQAPYSSLPKLVNMIIVIIVFCRS